MSLFCHFCGRILVKGGIGENKILLIQKRHMNLTTIVSPHGTKAHARFVNDRINGAEFCLKIYDIMHDLSILCLISR